MSDEQTRLPRQLKNAVQELADRAIVRVGQLSRDLSRLRAAVRDIERIPGARNRDDFWSLHTDVQNVERALGVLENTVKLLQRTINSMR